jgi:hypothetical protein
MREGSRSVKIRGIEGMSVGELRFALQQGGKFVCFQYCVSIILLTFRRPSPIYFVKAGESAVTRGLPFTLVSLVFGWWGIPWGPIFTMGAVVTNFRGGKDVTQQVVTALSSGPQ